jgi:hypothetical protein
MRRIINLIVLVVIVASFFALAAQRCVHNAENVEGIDTLSAMVSDRK